VSHVLNSVNGSRLFGTDVNVTETSTETLLELELPVKVEYLKKITCLIA